MKYGRSLQELAIELDRQAKVKKDYVATAGAMQMTAVNENFDLVIGNTPFQLNKNAHRQLGLQLKIPAPYYERMRAENPGLLMANVNGWFQQSPDTRRMVRTLDGTARAILSDRYRRIDNYEVAQTVLPIISEMQGARIESCELTDVHGKSGGDPDHLPCAAAGGNGCWHEPGPLCSDGHSEPDDRPDHASRWHVHLHRCPDRRRFQLESLQGKYAVPDHQPDCADAGLLL